MTTNREMDDLTPDERSAWEALPRTGEIPAGLEDGTVRLLRAHGVLRDAPRRRRWPRIAGLAAAAGVIFALGVGVGARAAAEPSTSPAESSAMRVQRTGTEYVSALASLEPSADGNAATEVALNTFHGAARELTRLTGPAALAEQVLAATGPTADETGAAATRSVIWF